MDNNEVYSLFEDIKNDLKGINGKLENAPKVTNNQSGGQPTAVDLTPIKELFDSSAREHQAQTKAMLTKFAEAEVYASNRILHLLRDFEGIVCPKFGRTEDTEPQEHIHRHQIRHPVQARYFLFWSAWASYAAFPSGATSSFGNPSVSMRTMR